MYVLSAYKTVPGGKAQMKQLHVSPVQDNTQQVLSGPCIFAKFTMNLLVSKIIQEEKIFFPLQAYLLIN